MKYCTFQVLNCKVSILFCNALLYKNMLLLSMYSKKPVDNIVSNFPLETRKRDKYKYCYYVTGKGKFLSDSAV